MPFLKKILAVKSIKSPKLRTESPELRTESPELRTVDPKDLISGVQRSHRVIRCISLSYHISSIRI